LATSNLNECPFCGKEPYISRTCSCGEWTDYYFVRCDACGLVLGVGMCYESPEEAEKAWNNRKPCETCSEDKRIAIKVGMIRQSSEGG
jgi:hypothetical protein